MSQQQKPRTPAMTGCFDADHHASDLPDDLPGYMDPAFRERGWRIVEDADGSKRLAIGDFTSQLDFNRHTKPGSFRENILRLRAGEDLDPFQGSDGPLLPEYIDRDERLAFIRYQNWCFPEAPSKATGSWRRPTPPSSTPTRGPSIARWPSAGAGPTGSASSRRHSSRCTTSTWRWRSSTG